MNLGVYIGEFTILFPLPLCKFEVFLSERYVLKLRKKQKATKKMKKSLKKQKLLFPTIYIWHPLY